MNRRDRPVKSLNKSLSDYKIILDMLFVKHEDKIILRFVE